MIRWEGHLKSILKIPMGSKDQKVNVLNRLNKAIVFQRKKHDELIRINDAY